MNSKTKKYIPADGLAGLKENFSTDAVSGFIVFLLALPLSLGIAKASEFPPLMGLVTAIIGGILVSFLMGSRLTIKGPAAGLIVIVAGAVAEFGGGDNVKGWHLALGAMVVAGIIQILFGVLKLGKLADFFPLSAIHGMLAAIGLIIIAKQIPVLLNVDAALTKGKGPLALYGEIPTFIANLNPYATVIGVVSLAIMMGWPYIKNPIIKKIPAPLVVLVIAIPSQIFFGGADKGISLVKLGSFVDSINVNVSFDGISQTGLFVKYVIMFALVGTLESLLTVKAIDLMDPFKRKSNANKDLIAVGIGNTLAAVFGGIPMIAEVARSSSNVNNGAKTRWANFFHGFFILTFVLLATPLIEKIPTAALAAMLISVGIKLAHPKEFIHTFHIGKEQLVIFLVTIFFTMFEDLLVGIAAGIVLKMIIHIVNGTPVSSFFKAPTVVSFEGNEYLVEIDKAAVFTNYLGVKRKLEEIPTGFNVTINLKKTKFVDHSVMESLHLFKNEYESVDGGTVKIKGLEKHKPLSDHEFAGRKLAN